MTLLRNFFGILQEFGKKAEDSCLKLAFKITLTKPEILWNVNVQIATVCTGIFLQTELLPINTLEGVKSTILDPAYWHIFFAKPLINPLWAYWCTNAIMKYQGFSAVTDKVG